MHKLQETLFRLLFDRNDDLDLLQIIFLGWVVFVSYTVHKVGSGEWTLPTAGWSVIASVFATLAIAGTPKWIAILLANRREPQMFPTYTQVGGYSLGQYDQSYDQWYGVDDPEVTSDLADMA